MRLKIDNLAKIKHADIIIDGITVIAGENNTGKSTIGKVLYSAFNSLFNMDTKIEERRSSEIIMICDMALRSIVIDDYWARSDARTKLSSRKFSDKISRELTQKLLDISFDSFDKVSYEAIIRATFTKYAIEYDDDTIKKFVSSSYEKIRARKENNNYTIALELIQRFFGQVFDSQINCLKMPQEQSNITLTIQEKDISLDFVENNCTKWDADYNILHEAFFVDDPFVLDELNEYHPFMASTNGIKGRLIARLRESENDIMQGLFEAVNAKERIKEIYDILEKVTDGDILLRNGEWWLNSKQYEKPLHFVNLSAGLKSFVLIKMLLEKAILKEKDVLILDEPEIHLHPEWQLVYAEIIVLLQKKFDLSIVVTTHSRDFLEAIELYIKKYGLDSKCNFYMSKITDGLAVFENVTDCLGKVYKQLVTPSMLLDKLRYEIGKEEDE